MSLILPPPRPTTVFPVLARGETVPDALRGAVVAIGNFDGVHRGHKHVVEAARGAAAREGRPVVVMTFEPHPRSYFQPDVPLFRLSDAAAKVRLLAGLGIDALAVLPFDRTLAETSADAFETGLLVEWLGAAVVVVGRDFHYGARRGGNAETLRKAGLAKGFGVVQVEALDSDAGTISSSAIRHALAAGDLDAANGQLGHSWFVSATVIHGEKRGRTLGYPTANLRLDPACSPRHGIYAVKVGLDGRWLDGVASFGRRPTFDNGAPLLEVHVFDLNESLYDRELDIVFAGYIRGEAKFDSLEALIAQMDQDSRDARNILNRG
ncbi:MAG: bifunctional riboflavin kinase/FAD synthetase [Phreatobacter sp.]|uniref:bifunctional riboflavin kinase/FAD synthetase n=1 Tax=Phreatobacter sp. TaxID=1966341 RepID=UPI002735465C|nr:bifunctional riboflavin kinase/FAD synthetase [Phreatobacter sp.]MDP2803859.1 bifunctional riboflavin kinase/FAD synthetase [Phreatobacter sp.]